MQRSWRMRQGRAGCAVLVLALLSTGLATARTRSPAMAPVISIPVDPLGYRPPGQIYTLARLSLASLDFLDATHLLFTFHQHRLLRRDPHETGESQLIRAVVLELPSGKETASAEWRMNNRQRYLWPIADGKVLVRQGDELAVAGADLELHPILRLPTTLRDTFVSPRGEMLVVESDLERHTPEEHKAQELRALRLGDNPPPEDIQIRMIRLDEKALVFRARADQPAKLIANDTGYLTRNETTPNQWEVRLHPFTDPDPKAGKVVGQVASLCEPDDDLINSSTVLVRTCPIHTADHLTQAFKLDGKHLWDGRWRANFTWPTYATAANGSTFAVGWLGVSHPIDNFDPVSDTDVEAQVIYVLDAKTGGLRLSVAIKPILTAGQNFALSPDGNRLAVLNRGALEVYDVPKAESGPPAEQDDGQTPPPK